MTSPNPERPFSERPFSPPDSEPSGPDFAPPASLVFDADADSDAHAHADSDPDAGTDTRQETQPAPTASTPPTDASPSVPETAERPHPLTPIVQVWIWVVGALMFVVRQAFESPGDVRDFFTRMPFWVLAFLGIGVVSVGGNLWTWWTTRFVITPTELRVEHRGVEHESKRVAYQRIQSVDVVQPFAARLLGLAQLTIEVGADKPIKLQYLARSRAVELRDLLLHRAHGREAPGAPAAISAWDDSGASDRVLIKVPPAELVIGALASHDLLALLLATAIPLIIGVIINQPLLIGGGIFPMLLAIAGFISKRVIGQWGYTLAQTPAGLRITRGLATLSSETLPTRRIQAIRIHEPVLWRTMQRARVDLSMLGTGRITSNEDGAGASSIMLPIGRPDDVRTALDAVWPGLNLDSIALRPAPNAARWLAPLAFRWIGYGWDDQVLVFRRGWWTRTTWIMPHARLQSAHAEEGPIRRRLGVATVAVHTTELAGGTPTTFMSDADARAFVFAEMDRARDARSADALLTPNPAASEPAAIPFTAANR